VLLLLLLAMMLLLRAFCLPAPTPSIELAPAVPLATVGSLLLRHDQLSPTQHHTPAVRPRVQLSPLSAAAPPLACTTLKAAAPRIVMKAAAKRGPVILQKRSWQVSLSGVVCGIVVSSLAVGVCRAQVTRLFALHVACMAPMLPFGVAAVATVRRRLTPPETKSTEPSARKKRGEWLVIRHFLTSATAFYVSTIGLAGIWLHKETLGLAHLSTSHAWLGVSAWTVWLAAYVSAQPHVWRDQIRARKFSLLTNKRWLWSSKLHRRLGTLAFVLSLAAYCSGLVGWSLIAPEVAIASSIAVGAICASSIGLHGARQVAAVGRDKLATAAAAVMGVTRDLCLLDWFVWCPPDRSYCRV